LHEELEPGDWLAAETKKRTLAKLDASVANIGYPDRWRDYTALRIDRKSYFENDRAAAIHDRSYQLAT
jgi:putative endopeptidase